MTKKNWKTYEEVSIYLLNQFKKEFGLDDFTGKQKVSGNKSKTEWEIDGKGFIIGNDKFVIVECRRYTTKKQTQENVGALAYRIADTGAYGGIIVSPLGLQEGAKKVASAENIISVKLTPESTTGNYILQFLNNIKIGITDRITISDSIDIKITDKNGNIVDERHY